MRVEFCQAIEHAMIQSDSTFFLTGDLGFNALESVQKVGGDRFVNSGVAEQSMIGVAAGIASLGNEAFVYSIAPFTTFRCLEQIRLDVCIHDLPVYIVGNGGGYGYGIMGSTHHAIEDIGCMSTLDNMTCWIPAFSDDVGYCVDQLRASRKPGYLRLGMGPTRPTNATPCAPVSTVASALDSTATVVCLGPIVGNVLAALEVIDGQVAVDVLSVIRIPLSDKDISLIAESIKKSRMLIVIEEHVARGGLAEYILPRVLDLGLPRFTVKRPYAAGYPNKLYGSQRYHQQLSGLDPTSIASLLRSV